MAVDAETGLVEILDYCIVEDGGRMVNPMIVDGQTYGGAAQGIGTALFEEIPYDAAGQPLASTLVDYLLPGPTELPKFRIHHSETLSPHTAHGIKGIGEGGAIAPPAAIVNAINDALAATRRAAERYPGLAGADPGGAGQGARGVKAAAFDYVQARSIAEAVALLAAGDARVLAGGQSLGPMLNLRLARPGRLVDVKRAAGLREVAADDAVVSLGAGWTHAEIEDGAVEDPTRGLLRQVAQGIAYRAVRNRGTIGGSLAHADPAADWVSTIVALGGAVVAEGPGGRRRIAAEGFIRGAFATALAAGRGAGGGGGAAARARGALGLSQALPQDRRIRQGDRRGGARSPHRLRAGAGGGGGGPPVLLADAAACLRDRGAGGGLRGPGRGGGAAAAASGAAGPGAAGDGGAARPAAGGGMSRAMSR